MLWCLRVLTVVCSSIRLQKKVHSKRVSKICQQKLTDALGVVHRAESKSPRFISYVWVVVLTPSLCADRLQCTGDPLESRLVNAMDSGTMHPKAPNQFAFSDQELNQANGICNIVLRRQRKTQSLQNVSSVLSWPILCVRPTSEWNLSFLEFLWSLVWCRSRLNVVVRGNTLSTTKFTLLLWRWSYQGIHVLSLSQPLETLVLHE